MKQLTLKDITEITFRNGIRTALADFGIYAQPILGGVDGGWRCKLPNGEIKDVSQREMEKLMEAYVDVWVGREEPV